MVFPGYTNRDNKSVFEEFGSSDRGLTLDKVKLGQAKYGLNITGKKEVRWWQVFARQFRSGFVYLLISAGLLTFYLGEHIDTALIFLFVAINAGLGFRQEYHSEKTISILKKYLEYKCKVRRGGEELVIDSKELVPGDVVLLQAGDNVPADLRLFKVHDLLIDESALTGESLPVLKTTEALRELAADMYKAKNIVFGGTTVVEGNGEGVVIATAESRVISDIAKIAPDDFHESLFDKGLRKFSRFILTLVFITLFIVFCVQILTRPDFSSTTYIIFAIALAISVVPEALPLVVTFSLSRGAIRLAKRDVVIKKLSAIEGLGSIDILCTDKTGTITENKLSVSEIFSKDESQTILYANLCNSVGIEKAKESKSPFDEALYAKLDKNKEKIASQFKRIAEISFDPNRRRTSVLVEKGDIYELVVVGAPEKILGFSKNLKSDEVREIESWVKSQGLLGRRVIAVAKKSAASRLDYKVEEEEHDLIFLGVISFVDPIKPSTKGAIKDAENLGIKIKILTGDSKEVAGAVGHEIGLINAPAQVITGDELEAMPEKDRYTAALENAVFARVSPKQKYTIIELLRRKDRVGFLGEGMNDVPALKAADVSLVVQNAADIARDAADIILLQKNLEVIIDGVKFGREVFTNIVKYVKATLASNLGNFYAVATASLLINYLPMLPLQILLVNLLSDFPMMTIATDNVDKSELKKPKQYDAKGIVIFSIIIGLVSTLFDFIFFGLFFRSEPAVLQTNWFIGSILTELVLVFSIRTHLKFWKAKAPSLTLIAFSAIAFISTLILPMTKFGEQVFKFKAPTVSHLIIILAIVLIYFVITETVKVIFYKNFNPMHRHRLKH